MALFAIFAGAPAHAAPTAGERATAHLEVVGSARPVEERREAATALAALAPRAVEELRAFLGRTRTSTEAERRAVLAAIRADVPDREGRFRASRKEPVNRGDDFDWLGGLFELDTDLPGMTEVLADVATIRALAASKTPDGAEAILDFGFTADGLIYRDECGRWLRKMSPYSLPILITASQNNDSKQRALQRYASYQLDRLDRQDPNKALGDAAVDPRLVVKVISAYGQSKHREAIAPLVDRMDDNAPNIRAAARDALLGYVTGPKPPEAPRRRLVLPGGRLSDEPQPLWLNYLELAEVELRRKHEEVFEERAPRRSTPEALARKLFAHYDELRTRAEKEAYEEALAHAEAGALAQASAAFDRLLATRPDHPQRAAMARIYYEHARALAQTGAYREASAAYSKAHGLDPEAPHARDALAAHYATLGKALEAEGKDASGVYGRALEVEPDHQETLEARALGSEARPAWMLYAGLGGGAGALVLLILGLAVRRR